MNITEQFLQIKSNAHRQGRSYTIHSLLLLVTTGLLAGCDSYASICRLGRTLSKPLLKKLGLLKGPCLSTITENMRKVDVASLEAVLVAAGLSLLSPPPCDGSSPPKTPVGLDGKALRGSKRQKDKALHLLGLFSHQTMKPYKGTALEEGENEISAAIRFLETLDLSQLIITGDAIFTQQEITEKIVKKGGDFVLTVKGNQERLLHEIQEGFEHASPESVRRWEEPYDKGHGRIEKRSIVVMDMPWEYQNAWQNIAQIACITRHREVKSKGIWGKETVERAYVITSLKAAECTPQQLLQYNRQHWHIENKGHWVRDVIFREDASTIRFSAKAASALRSFASFILMHVATSIAAARQIFSHKPHLAVQQLSLRKFK